MKESTNSASNAFAFELPQLSLKVISFLQIGFYIALALVVYYILRRTIQLMTGLGALERRSIYFKIVNVATFTLPGVIFLYGLTKVSKDSLFVALLFFVIFSIIFGFSLIEPTKALFSSLLINLRGDLKVGDYITIDRHEGEIAAVGPFNIVLHSKSGARVVIPSQKVIQQAYELHAKKGGPAIIVTMSAEKISKKNLERLAHLCPFKRQGSDIRISTQEGEHRVSIEIINRESRPWVIKYFQRHAQ